MKKKRILELLHEAARTSEDIVAFMIGSSLSRRPGLRSGLRVYQTLQKERKMRDPRGEHLRLERKRVRRILGQLKQDGLIETRSRKREATYQVTQQGAQWLTHKSKPEVARLERNIYTKTPSDVVVIVAYDIPEKSKRFRDWLRAELMALGFSMLQKSVFVGKVKIPKKLIEDLAEFGLSAHVQIFEITKAGTLRLTRKI